VNPPLRLILDSDALMHNWRWLARASGRAACGAAVKADGYGLGAREVVARLGGAGCRDFFVATWDEAEALGALPEGAALAVLHGVREEDMAAALASPARPVLNSAAQVARWRAAAPGRPCDIMVDTGMNRLGLTPEEARSGLLDGLAIETLMSHLACADEPDHPLNEQQLFTFRMLRGLIPAKRYSLANSAGILLGPRFTFGLTRPGLALYGGVQAEGLRPVVGIEAQVLQVRTAAPGSTIGYGATYAVPASERVAILNIGYADGYLRIFGEGVGAVRLGEALLPVRGRVSMDLLAIGIGKAKVAEGDWLTLEYSLPAMAAATSLSQYELLTLLGRRYQRRWT
jgi:alanine racemase